MDTTIYGPKGSGKSYYAAYKISELKEKDKVLHNIQGLKIGINIDEEAEKLGIKPIDFFRNCFHDDETPDNTRFDERFLKYRGFLFVIDEAVDIFPYHFKDEEVLKFFRMSRHWIIDVILITQDIEDLCKSISKKAELKIKAIPDIANPFPGFFLYHEMSGREQVGTIKLRKKKQVFASYKSADYNAASPRRKKKPMQMLLIGALVLSLGAAGGFLYFVKKRKDRNAAKQEQLQNSPSPQATTSLREKGNRQLEQRFSSAGSEPGKYPLSVIDKLGGVLVPVSTFEDSTGHYVIILDMPYNIENAPFPIHKSRFGYVALVPEDLYQFRQYQKEQKQNQVYTDPNQPYYWQDKESSFSLPSPPA